MQKRRKSLTLKKTNLSKQTDKHQQTVIAVAGRLNGLSYSEARGILDEVGAIISRHSGVVFTKADKAREIRPKLPAYLGGK